MILKPQTTVRLQANIDLLLAALADLSAEIPKAPLEVIDRLFGLPHSIDELAFFEINTDSTSAVDVIVRFYPSESLGMLCSALRARNIDALVIK